MSKRISFGDLPDDLKDKPMSDPAVQAWVDRKADETITQNDAAWENRMADLNRQPDPKKPDLPSPSNADFFNDPARSTEKVVLAKAPTREEFNQQTAQMQRHMIMTAEMMMERAVKDWAVFGPDVKKAMTAMDPSMQADPAIWNTCYLAIKGSRADQMVEAARAEGRKGNAETVQPVDTPKPINEITLDADQKAVARSMGLSEDAYKRAMSRTNSWPITGASA